MEQTFYDVCRVRAATGGSLFGLTFWLCLDTLGGIVSEHIQLLGLPPKSIARAALVTGVVLLIPLWGVIYVDDWNWDWHGFVIAGAFVFSAAMLYEFAAKTMRNRAYKLAVGLAVTTSFLVAWSNFVQAVDVNLFNFMYHGVVVLGLVGAAVARFRARGMAVVMAAMAIAQALVPLIALVFWNTKLAGVLGGNGVAIVLFAVSAWLFRRAARTHEMTPT